MEQWLKVASEIKERREQCATLPNDKGFIHDSPFMTVLIKMSEIHEAKNTDYGNSYELAAGMLGRPVVEVLLGRMTDKLARACNLVRRNGQAAVKDESLADTLLDLANYAVLGVVALGNNQEDK